MAKNPYFEDNAIATEQSQLTCLYQEIIEIWGQNFYYIPRSSVNVNELLGEDSLSEFKNAYLIEMYLENVEGFEGQGAYLSKFGITIEQSGTLIVSKPRWEELVGTHGDTIVPNRPNEGDLIYYPLADTLFEIKFVNHQNAFYQLDQIHTYRLSIEAFQYSSENIDTGNEDIDAFESLRSFDDTITDEASQNYGDGDKYEEKKDEVIFDEKNPFGIV